MGSCQNHGPFEEPSRGLPCILHTTTVWEPRRQDGETLKACCCYCSRQMFPLSRLFSCSRSKRTPSDVRTTTWCSPQAKSTMRCPSLGRLRTSLGKRSWRRDLTQASVLLGLEDFRPSASGNCVLPNFALELPEQDLAVIISDTFGKPTTSQ